LYQVEDRPFIALKCGRIRHSLVDDFIFPGVVSGCWLLDAGYWLLVTGCWLLVAGYWLLVTGYW